MKDSVLAFMHIPKTAGTSVTAFLKPHYREDAIIELLGGAAGNTNFGMPFHKLPSEVFERCELVTGHFPRNFLYGYIRRQINYITFLRNPIDLFISRYNYAIRMHPTSIGYEKSRRLSFLEFLRDDEIKLAYKNTSLTKCILNMAPPQDICQEEYQRFLRDVNPSQNFVCQPDDVLFEWAKSILDRFLFVGVVELYQESLFLLSYCLGFTAVWGHYPLNVTKEKFVEKERLTPEELKAIEDITTVDRRLYEYFRKKMTQQYNEMVFSLLSAGNLPDLPKPDFSFKFDFPMTSDGWYGKETRSDGKTYNWTGPETIARVLFDRMPNCAYGFKIQAVMCLSPDILDSLKIEVNGCEALYNRITNDGGFLLQGVLPKDMVLRGEGNLEIKFHVNRTQWAIPGQPDHPQNRLIGIAFSYLELTPLL